MKIERPILPYVKVLAALRGGPADGPIMKMLVRSRKKTRSLSRKGLAAGAVAVSGSAVFMAALASGALPTTEDLAPIGAWLVLCGFGIVFGSLALCWVAITTYRWMTYMHEQITEALAGEVEMFSRLGRMEPSSYQHRDAHA